MEAEYITYTVLVDSNETTKFFWYRNVYIIYIKFNYNLAFTQITRYAHIVFIGIAITWLSKAYISDFRAYIDFISFIIHFT